MKPQLQMLIEQRDLHPYSAAPEEVAGFWQMACEAYRDVHVSGSSEANRFGRAYDAARLAATSVLYQAGYRPRQNAMSHHQLVFNAVRHLDLPGISDQMREVDEYRSMRNALEYTPPSLLTPKRVVAGLVPLTTLLGRLLPIVHAHLKTQLPATVALEATPTAPPVTGGSVAPPTGSTP